MKKFHGYTQVWEKVLLVGVACVVCVFSAVSPADATYILGANSATYSGTSTTSTTLMIDHSGLATDYLSGVDDFDAYNPGTVLHEYQYGGGSINEWFANYPNPASGSVVFDLGGLYTVDRIAFWNEDGEGVSGVGVSFSTDNVTYGSVESFMPTDNTWGASYFADIFTLSSSSLAKYVKFDLIATSADDGFINLSIGEVAFSVAESSVPEPATMILFGTGILGLLGVRRRK